MIRRWYFGMHIEWSWIFTYLRARREGLRVARTIQRQREDLALFLAAVEHAPTMPMPRVIA